MLTVSASPPQRTCTSVAGPSPAGSGRLTETWADDWKSKCLSLAWGHLEQLLPQQLGLNGVIPAPPPAPAHPLRRPMSQSRPTVPEFGPRVGLQTPTCRFRGGLRRGWGTFGLFLLGLGQMGRSGLRGAFCLGGGGRAPRACRPHLRGRAGGPPACPPAAWLTLQFTSCSSCPSPVHPSHSLLPPSIAVSGKQLFRQHHAAHGDAQAPSPVFTGKLLN